LCAGAPAALQDKIEQVVRLIRSKGVGVYFVTQNPLDVPDKVLGQLGNRVQHALRAFTPRDQKAVKTAAETLRANPKFDAETAITELGVGEALVSFLDEKGSPQVVERGFVLVPFSRIGPLTPQERKAAIEGSVIFGHYEQSVDRESAYEKLKGAQPAAPAAPQKGSGDMKSTEGVTPTAGSGGGVLGSVGGVLGDLFGGGGSSRRQGVGEALVKSAARAIGSQVGREIIRGVLGSILGGRRR
jgi:DNA helicase HerA-like ATPase